ncbi:MAG TPA: dihydrofolate reductase [Candidatus Melainabacteria bacterium]|jgi:dihydrofolate reductase|nr:dihydrofolate reductase [Candidatus Melainabacteria bacterium]HIN66998.1 dihydrofolate reductase [Candidatus Obscuribacterales bacterium]
MKTQYYTATSLDGFIADENNSLDWLMQFGEPGGSYPPFIAEVGAIAMGSTTYEWLLEHEINKDSEKTKPWPYEQPVWVFSSRSLSPVANADIRFCNGDVAPIHREMTMAANGKNIWIVGGGELAGQFFDKGLLDEFIITITPVTLGAGAPLFPRRIATPPLNLVAVQQYGKHYVEVRYEVAKQPI